MVRFLDLVELINNISVKNLQIIASAAKHFVFFSSLLNFHHILMPENTTKAILIDVIDRKTSKEKALSRLTELENLVNTYGGIVVIKTIQKKDLPDYETYIGKGKVQEILEQGRESNADIVIVNNLLKARQIYKLNEIFRKAKVSMKAWDRVDLILKIFDKHAESTQAKLQIELASIRHMGPRIFGMGIELSRQAGAMGVRAGAGESNIEIMKRHLQDQELNIMKKLKHYEVIDEGHRLRRRRQNFKTVAIVGYTNAGKSSLLRALTGKDVYVADKLFATLDTKMGKLYVPHHSPGGEYKGGTEILISDTIGFIQDLPPSLIQAFKSTLAEAIDADLILHVIDINDPEIHEKIEVVEEILKQLGLRDKPKIYGFNKVDLIAPRSMFDPSEMERGKRTLLKAGKGTSELLGWHTGKKKGAALKIINSLKRKYDQFTPLFFSAEEKLNLEKLIKEIVANLIRIEG